MLINYGIPSGQIVAVSAGEKDLKVQTGDNVKNAENRRVRVVKEEKFEEPAPDPSLTKVKIISKQGHEYGHGHAHERMMGFPVEVQEVFDASYYGMPEPLFVEEQF